MSEIVEKRKTTLTPKQLLIIFFLGLGYTIVYATPFIQYVFYDSLVEGLNCSNQQLGILISIFGIGNLLAPFGGALSDRFNTKTIYIVSMALICALNLLFAFNMNYTFALFIWAGFAIAGLFLYFPAHTKLTRLIASEDQQGTLFGFTESFCGITNVIVNFIALWLFTKFATDSYGVLGLRAAIIGYAVLGIIAIAFLWVLVPKPTNETMQKSADEKMTMKDWVSVMTNPRTWFSGIAVFATYTMYCTLSYYTPYFSNVLGVSVVFTGGLAIIRTYGTRFIGAPFGGWLGDKFHSVSRVVGASLAGATVLVLVFMLMPAGTNAGVLLVLTLCAGILTYMARGSMFAIPSELKIPRKYAGSTSGLVCAIGYCPDLFIFILFGKWLDTYGNAGYSRIFIYAAVVMMIGVANAVVTHLYKKKHNIA
ncbi:Inner membrane protein YqcE [bioreactor metagenome]|uniref:Inner membrane protein YqcE n=1 Tax=bioreactor metagenome TaxID=1076179 RepID=A0A644X7C6_9ZZZZ